MFKELTSEVSEHKKQHLMIFMRALLTTTIGQCHVRAWNTELATVGLYKAVVRFMTSPNVPNHSQLLVNEIHGQLQAGYNPDKVRQRLRAQMHFSYTSYSPQILPPTWTIS